MVCRVLLLVGCLVVPKALFSWEEATIKYHDGRMNYFYSQSAEKEAKRQLENIALKIHGFTPDACSSLLTDVDKAVVDSVFSQRHNDMVEIERKVRVFCASHSFFAVLEEPDKAKLWAKEITEVLIVSIKKNLVAPKSPLGKMIPYTKEQENDDERSIIAPSTPDSLPRLISRDEFTDVE